MYIIFLKFGPNRGQAKQFMAAHQGWIQQGVDDGVFLLVGTLQPNRGGVILTQAVPQDALLARVEQDPFVKHGVVAVEVHEVSPAKAHHRLSFLVQDAP